MRNVDAIIAYFMLFVLIMVGVACIGCLVVTAWQVMMAPKCTP